MKQLTDSRWTDAHRTALDAFVEGWLTPSPHAWDRLLAPDVELVQPLLRNCRGREQWWREAARLMRLVPDLRGEVLSWSATGDTMFIDVRFTGTLGGRPLTWRAVDVLTLDATGTVLRRESHFDSVPLILTVLRRPRAWLAYWRRRNGDSLPHPTKGSS